MVNTEDDNDLRCPICGLPDRFCDKTHSDLREWLTHGSAKDFRVAPEVLMQLIQDDEVVQ